MLKGLGRVDERDESAIGAISVNLAAETNEHAPEYSKSSLICMLPCSFTRPQLLLLALPRRHPRTLWPKLWPASPLNIPWISKTMVASLEAHRCLHLVVNGDCATCTTFPRACAGSRQHHQRITMVPTLFVVELLDVKQNG
jgi:hypothetical protein